MTELRKRMIESLQLGGMSERTQEAYVRAVRQLAQHYKKSPDLISEEELRQYFLYIKNVKKYSRPTTTIALCGIKFFVQWTLGRQSSPRTPSPSAKIILGESPKPNSVFTELRRRRFRRRFVSPAPRCAITNAFSSVVCNRACRLATLIVFR